MKIETKTTLDWSTEQLLFCFNKYWNCTLSVCQPLWTHLTSIERNNIWSCNAATSRGRSQYILEGWQPGIHKININETDFSSPSLEWEQGLWALAVRCSRHNTFQHRVQRSSFEHSNPAQPLAGHSHDITNSVCFHRPQPTVGTCLCLEREYYKNQSVTWHLIYIQSHLKRIIFPRSQMHFLFLAAVSLTWWEQ